MSNTVGSTNQDLETQIAEGKAGIISGLLKIFLGWCQSREIKIEPGSMSPDGQGRLLTEDELNFSQGTLERRYR